jgi:hypothetical protein
MWVYKPDHVPVYHLAHQALSAIQLGNLRGANLRAHLTLFDETQGT